MTCERVNSLLPLYVDDLAEAAVLALTRGEPGEAYAVWDDTARITFEEHLNRIARMVGGREARRVPRPLLELSGAVMGGWGRLRGRPPPFTASSATFLDRRGTVAASNARERLGWAPRVAYEEGMRRTGVWLRREGLPQARADRAPSFHRMRAPWRSGPPSAAS